jgi:xanthine dehydrogenase iron-sulfur cluster and FAD-binding subunit A
MKPSAFDYRAPTSLDEALALLAANPDAKLLAGGQSLVPVLNFRLAAPPLLVDLNRIPELAGVVFAPDGALTVGAMTRHRVFETDAAVGAPSRSPRQQSRTSRTFRSAIAAPSAGASAMPIPRPSGRRSRSPAVQR